MNKENKEVNRSLGILARSAAVVFAGLVLSKIFSYAYRILIARFFGPDIYGVFLIALGVVGILVHMALLGFESGLVRYIPLFKSKGDEKKTKYLVGFGLHTIIVLGVLFGVLLFLFSETISLGIFHEARLVFFLKTFSLLVPVLALTGFFLAIINGYERIGWFSFIENIWKTGSKIVFLVFLMLLGLGFRTVPISFFLASVSSLIISFIVMRKQTPRINIHKGLGINERRTVRKEFLNFSLPLLFFYVISVLMAWVDSFSIGYFKGATEVGIYNAAVPIALLLYMAPQLFTKLFLPMVTREYGKKRMGVVRQLSQQVGKWILLINIPLFLILFLFPENFIRLFFGGEFVSSAIALRILLVNTLFLSVGRVSNRLLVMAGRTRIVLVDIIIAVCVNLVLNILLIPLPSVFGVNNSSGLVGAAFATSIASVLIGLLFMVQAKRSISILPFRRKMVQLFLAGLLAAGITFFVSKFFMINNLVLVFLSIFLGLFYLVLAFIFRGFDRNDVLLIKKLRGKLFSDRLRKLQGRVSKFI